MLGGNSSPPVRKASSVRRTSERAERPATGRSSLPRATGEVNSPGVPAQLPRRKPSNSSSAPLLSQADDRAGIQTLQGDDLVSDVSTLGVSLGSVPAAIKDTHVAVFACGQNLQLEIQPGGLFFADIHSQLQMALRLEGRVFQFFSAHGEPVSTDEELRDIVSRGEIPLTACLTEAQVPHMEMQHEELVQMQWKLLKEQYSLTSERVTEVSNQVHELSEALDIERSAHKANVERLQSDLQAIADGVRESCKCDLMQLAERVNAVSQLLAKERNVHKAATQGVELQIQNVRDGLEGERSWMRQEILRATNSMLQDSRCLLEAEAHARQALEDRYSFDIKKLEQRIEEFTWTQTKEAQERGQAYKKAALEADQALQATRQLSNTRAEIEAYVSNSAARQQELEDRCISLEAKMLDRQLLAFDQFGDSWCNTGNEKPGAEKKPDSPRKDLKKSMQTGMARYPDMPQESNEDLVKRVAALEKVAKKLEVGEGRLDSGFEGGSSLEKIDTERGPIADVETKLRQNMEPAEEAPRSVTLAASARNVQFISTPLQSNRVISVVQPVPMMRPSTATPSYVTPIAIPSSVTMTPSSSPQQVGRDITVEQPLYYLRSPSVDKFAPAPGASPSPSMAGSMAAPAPTSPPPHQASSLTASTGSAWQSYMVPPAMSFAGSGKTT